MLNEPLLFCVMNGTATLTKSTFGKSKEKSLDSKKKTSPNPLND